MQQKWKENKKVQQIEQIMSQNPILNPNLLYSQNIDKINGKEKYSQNENYNKIDNLQNDSDGEMLKQGVKFEANKKENNKSQPNLYKEMLAGTKNLKNPSFEENLDIVKRNKLIQRIKDEQKELEETIYKNLQSIHGILKGKIPQKEIIINPINNTTIKVNHPGVFIASSKQSNNKSGINSQNSENNGITSMSQEMQKLGNYSQNSGFKNPSERKDMYLLAKWLDQMLNQVFEEKSENFQSFYDQLELVFTGSITEIVRQISMDCRDRGIILQKIWDTYIRMTKDFFLKMQVQVKKQEREGLLDVARVHNMYKDEIARQLEECIRMGDKVQLYQNVADKMKLENTYLRKKQKKLEKTQALLQQQIDELNIDYMESVRENTQLKIHLEDLNYQQQQLPSLQFIENNNQTERVDKALEQSLSQIDSLKNSRQTKVVNNDQKNQFLLNIELIKKEIEKKYNQIYEERIAKIEQQYQNRENFKKQELEYIKKLDEQDREMEQHFHKEYPTLEFEFEHIVLENKKLDTADLIERKEVACDTVGFVSSSEQSTQCKSSDLVPVREKACQKVVEMVTRETEVNLAIIKKENKHMSHHERKIISNVQKSMVKFLEKVPLVNFPKNMVRKMQAAAPVLVSEEMEKMKQRTADIFFGLFSKEDMNFLDGQQVVKYFSRNWDSFNEFFNWLWGILQNMVDKGLDLKIAEVESFLKLKQLERLNKENQQIFLNLYQKYKELKEHVNEVNLNQQFQKANTLSVPGKDIKNRLTVSKFQHAGKKVLNMNVLKNVMKMSSSSQKQVTSFRKNSSNNSNMEMSFRTPLSKSSIKLDKLQSSNNININNNNSNSKIQSISNIADQSQQPVSKQESKQQVNIDITPKKKEVLNNTQSLLQSEQDSLHDISKRNSLKYVANNLQNNNNNQKQGQFLKENSSLSIKISNIDQNQNQIQQTKQEYQQDFEKIKKMDSQNYEIVIEENDKNATVQQTEKDQKIQNKSQNLNNGKDYNGKRKNKSFIANDQEKKSIQEKLDSVYDPEEFYKPFKIVINLAAEDKVFPPKQKNDEKKKNQMEQKKMKRRKTFTAGQIFQQQQEFEQIQPISQKASKLKISQIIEEKNEEQSSKYQSQQQNQNKKQIQLDSSGSLSPQQMEESKKYIQNKQQQKKQQQQIKISLSPSNDPKKADLLNVNKNLLEAGKKEVIEAMVQSKRNFIQLPESPSKRKRTSLIPRNMIKFMGGGGDTPNGKINKPRKSGVNTGSFNEINSVNLQVASTNELNKDEIKSKSYLSSGSSSSSSDDFSDENSDDQIQNGKKIGDQEDLQAIQEYSSDSTDKQKENAKKPDNFKLKKNQMGTNAKDLKKLKKNQNKKMKSSKKKLDKGEIERRKLRELEEERKLKKIEDIKDEEEDLLQQQLQEIMNQQESSEEESENDEKQEEDWVKFSKKDIVQLMNDISSIKQIHNMRTKTRSYKQPSSHATKSTDLLEKALKNKKLLQPVSDAKTTQKILQQICQFYTEVLKFAKANPDTKPPIMHTALYDQYINKFGQDNVYTDKKFQKFVQQVIQHIKEKNTRIQLAGRFLLGELDGMDFEFFINTIQDLDDSKQGDGIQLMSSGEDKVLVSLVKVKECIQNSFATNQVFIGDNYKLIKQAEKRIDKTSVKKQRQGIFVDLDTVLQELLDLYLVVKKDISEQYEDLFMSQSLNSEHRYINQKDFMMFYRYMENDDIKEMKKAGNIFQLEADYIDKSDDQNTRLMSLQRFTLVCLDNGLFSKEDQEELLQVEPKKFLENIKKNWREVQRELKLRLIHTKQYNIKEHNQIQRIEELMEKNTDEWDKLPLKQLAFTYIFLQIESKRQITEHLANQIIGEQLVELNQFLETKIPELKKHQPSSGQPGLYIHRASGNNYMGISRGSNYIKNRNIVNI
ncbi:hypothetical protein PPERSA_02956 [Pseudocohnilembus persalinus]|uniref:Uncharacterized protein n=1 Tax=Pseudocohnilembus persalinus TaxID=266149 RepID=A0A0V0QAN4_PSEPJ|nr:hypothetical protein PPERSA_02956 [Pseudocohnilembus persalinus]|eukprot:KRW99124.1 hypothetical protein PPERSA_02956 [Pseudocohnilembus persalinus]